MCAGGQEETCSMREENASSEQGTGKGGMNASFITLKADEAGIGLVGCGMQDNM